MVKEYTLSINDYNEPKVLEGKPAIATLLVRLLLLQPGTIPDRPKMGVGLVENFRYSGKDGVMELQKELEQQIATYLPRYQGANVTVSLNTDNTLTIGIQIDDILYKFETSELSDNSTSLIDLAEG